ncbi:M48 family metallopeptidase [Tahibacter amnicola]|uniref:M48 family metallopeptidase n=1 Tax=Tahibacter amnicola TaxID=2976241 RepID=A0ABY6B9J0_9GAMM|nr:M48 family metallopeptidase [Tahibacter amnicola]UXI66452.1 M48 family metallopeptidase [Tahibacter amnicola]
MKFPALILLLAVSSALPAVAADYYLVDTVAEQAPEADLRAQAQALERIYDDLAREAGVDARLIYSTDPDINAFATEVGTDKVVIVQEGLLASMDDDRDAVAAALGHELAHHKADHIRAGRRKQQGVRVFGAILGAVVGAKVGRNSGELAGAVSGAAVGVAGELLALKFSRNQELEADRLAVRWMVAAGYNPQGMLRLQKRLGELSGKRGASILSTHPTSTKRYQSAGKVIASLAPPEDLLARDVSPLVTASSLADATAAIKADKDKALAQALQTDIQTPSEAALMPVDGISFDTYAALGNELLHAGHKGKAKVLASHKLDESRLARLTASYNARMSEHPALSMRYSVGFFRASQGKLASYGRDLADSLEKGQPLTLEPPYALETGRALFAAMQARGAPSLDEAAQAAAEKEVLAEHGLSYYDYVIAHNWWSRKVTIAAMAGDTGLMRSYYGLQDAGNDKAEAEAAGVHIGDNVSIGENVRIGGKEQALEDDR